MFACSCLFLVLLRSQSWTQHVSRFRFGMTGGIPVIFSCVNKVLDFRVDYLKDSLFGRLLVVAKFLCRIKFQWTARRSGRPGPDQELLQLLAGRFEVLEIDEDLHDLAQIL